MCVCSEALRRRRRAVRANRVGVSMNIPAGNLDATREYKKPLADQPAAPFGEMGAEDPGSQTSSGCYLVWKLKIAVPHLLTVTGVTRSTQTSGAFRRRREIMSAACDRQNTTRGAPAHWHVGRRLRRVRGIQRTHWRQRHCWGAARVDQWRFLQSQNHRSPHRRVQFPQCRQVLLNMQDGLLRRGQLCLPCGWRRFCHGFVHRICIAVHKRSEFRLLLPLLWVSGFRCIQPYRLPHRRML